MAGNLVARTKEVLLVGQTCIFTAARQPVDLQCSGSLLLKSSALKEPLSHIDPISIDSLHLLFDTLSPVMAEELYDGAIGIDLGAFEISPPILEAFFATSPWRPIFTDCI